jgi:hypothetical protein
MLTKRKLVILLVIVVALFVFVSVGFADGFSHVINPATERVPAVVPPQLAPPKDAVTYVNQPAGTDITAPDKRSVAQLAAPPSDLAQELAVSIGEIRATPDPTTMSFQVLASVRYGGGGHTVLVTTARPSAAAAQMPVILGDTHKLADGSTAWTRTGMPGEMPNQVVFLRDDLIITVAGDLPISSLQELATRVVIR